MHLRVQYMLTESHKGALPLGELAKPQALTERAY